MTLSPSMKTATRGLLLLDRCCSIRENIDATPQVAARQLRANGNPIRVPVDYMPHAQSRQHDKLEPMGGNKSKRPRASYERGKLRDPSIEKMQDAKYQRGELARLIKKTVKGKAPEGA